MLTRLRRVEALEQEGAPPPLVLAELRELVREAQAWVCSESRGTERAAEAIARVEAALAADAIGPRL